MDTRIKQLNKDIFTLGSCLRNNIMTHNQAEQLESIASQMRSIIEDLQTPIDD